MHVCCFNLEFRYPGKWCLFPPFLLVVSLLFDFIRNDVYHSTCIHPVQLSKYTWISTTQYMKWITHDLKWPCFILFYIWLIFPLSSGQGSVFEDCGVDLCNDEGDLYPGAWACLGALGEENFLEESVSPSASLSVSTCYNTMLHTITPWWHRVEELGL